MPEWRYDEQAEPVRAPSAKEVRAILAAAETWDRRLWLFIRVTAASGARRGEVCGVRWSDIDWTEGSIRLDEAVIAAPGGGILKQPKTRTSVRTIAVDAGTLEALRSMRAEAEEFANDCGESLHVDGFVFSVSPDGLADLHLHSLRHFQSTEIDAVVTEAQKQARMGWSTIHMARHYTDAISSEDRGAADHIGVLLDQENC
jgi:integrase